METDLTLSDGRTLHVYDTGSGDGAARLAVFWHHGTPSTGAPPEPLFAAAAERGIRWVSHDRPGYGRSTPHPGRDVASAAARTPWPALRSCPRGSWPRCACRGLPRSAPGAWTGSRAWPP